MGKTFGILLFLTAIGLAYWLGREHNDEYPIKYKRKK